MAVAAQEWLDLIEREYIRDFIGAGGSAVKFVIVDPGDREWVERRIAELARGQGMLHLAVDVAAMRLHMIQDLFFALARQVDWARTTQDFVEALLRRQGLKWPNPGEPAGLDAVAEANSIDVAILRRDLRRWLTTELMRDTRMAQDFRVALTQLCLQCFEPPSAGDEGDLATLLDWLRGEARTIGPLRRLQISSRIGRHNARALLRSLCRWLRLCGHAGLGVCIDIRELARPGSGRAADRVRYSPAAVMDAYEVLRQLVDDADRMEGLQLIVLADETFLDGDPRRSIEAYVALKMRIYDDVRARGRDNPLAPLVRLERPGVARGDGQAFASEVP
jgi:hypothetical protein